MWISDFVALMKQSDRNKVDQNWNLKCHREAFDLDTYGDILETLRYNSVNENPLLENPLPWSSGLGQGVCFVLENHWLMLEPSPCTYACMTTPGLSKEEHSYMWRGSAVRCSRLRLDLRDSQADYESTGIVIAYLPHLYVSNREAERLRFHVLWIL
jgi:hypothetical protein